ncbi:thiosulfate oxidation carrier protein SoxY [Sinimarinibacterium thermocellulolyticum]|uniref:Thiosulfate oxidation carrier protein SoxY n=1 Tax=Sinimarinibacterium thermocellulolyticum TaxID=3170016 RepID=A0ABV2ADZ8_9GAMM
MTSTRRHVLISAGRFFAGLCAATVLQPLTAFAARNAAAFRAPSPDEALAALGATGAQPSELIDLQTPEIAENGAVVPVVVESRLPNTRAIAIMVEKNPSVLSARFEIPEGTDPQVATRVKVAETSAIIALVQTDEGSYLARKTVKVTLGGCGG